MAKETKPEWQKQTEEKQKLLKGGLFKQIAWISNDEYPCSPVALTDSMNQSVMPIVVDEPTGLQNPTYDWINRKWVERDTSALSEQVTQVIQDMKKVNETVEEVKQTQENSTNSNDQVVEAIKEMQAGQAQTTAVLSQVLPLLQQLSNTQKEGEA